MTYEEALGFMLARLPMFHRVGPAAYKPNLDNTIALLNLAGNPHLDFRSVHIAGTNGKGSVSHMLASILQESGLKVGLYTSPHLVDFRERIRIDGEKISKREVSGFIENLLPKLGKIEPSFFEMTVAMAFSSFRQHRVDIAVIETGLGGRLDSTNLIIPLVSAITNIGLDHTGLLGSSLPEIAAEKAGIIKHGIPVVIGETHPETSPVFIEKARLAGSPIMFADKVFTVRNVGITGEKTKFLVMNVDRHGKPYLEDLACPLLGEYQRKNILTVIQVVELLRQTGIEISNRQLLSGIRQTVTRTGLMGRWQILSEKPLTICDTGHNEDGIKEVVRQIRHTPHKTLHFVIGVVNDKEPGPVLALLPGDATYYFCKAAIPRGMQPEELLEKAAPYGLKGQVYSSVMEAFKAARRNASREDLVFVGGSTFTVAEVL